MAVWYSVIYGLLIAVACIYLVPSNDYSYLNEFYTISDYLLSGIVVALGIFILRFLYIQGRPYEITSSSIYPISKSKNKQIYNILEEVVIASGTSTLPKLYILNSDILNAYACGISPEKSSIVVSKGLIEILTRDELQGVIAHEMSHIANRDTTYLLCSGALYTISAAFSEILYHASRGRGKGSALCLLLFLISLLGQAICFILFMFISRKREYVADACASIYTRYPKGLADALLKIEQENAKTAMSDCEGTNALIKASFIVPLEGKDSLTSTHPSTQNRIKVLLNMTSADFREYEKEFQKLNNEKLLPNSALRNSEKVPIKEVGNIIKPQAAVLAACALSGAVSGEEQIKTIKENKEVLDENIKKHREVENMVRDLAGYYSIDCECGTKLKIPPVYKNTIVICPHCKRKHAAK